MQGARNVLMGFVFTTILILFPTHAFSEKLVISQFATGTVDGGFYRTLVSLSNPGPQPISGAIDIYSDTGTALEDLTQPFSLDAHETKILEIALDTPLVTGWLDFSYSGTTKLLASATIVASDLSGVPLFEVGLSASEDSSHFTLPVLVNDETDSGVSIVFFQSQDTTNASSVFYSESTTTKADVVLVLSGEDGRFVRSRPLEFNNRHKVARFVSELFPDEVKHGFLGSLRIFSSDPIYVLAIRQTNYGNNIVTSAPAPLLPRALLAKPSTTTTKEREPNNSISNAQRISLEANIEGDLESEDVDVFLIEVQEEAFVVGSIETVAQGFDFVADLELMDLTGSVIARNYSRIEREDFEPSFAKKLKSGVYYVRVRPEGWRNFGEQRNYMLKLHVTD